jgi:hypothetical protein
MSKRRSRTYRVYPFRAFAEQGGLLSYGNDQIDNFRRAASYADRVLKGEKPGELPVQAPVTYELVVNLKTANTLGLNVPLSLQQRADSLIDRFIISGVGTFETCQPVLPMSLHKGKPEVRGVRSK